MAATSVAPSIDYIEQMADGTRRWGAYWTATGYTVSMSGKLGGILHPLFGDGIAFVDHVLIRHATNAASERSVCSVSLSPAPQLGVMESTDTADIYQFYGPVLLKRLAKGATPDSILFLIADAFSEWTGNCTTQLWAFGRVLPRYEAVQAPTIVPEPTRVVLEKAEIWPWKR